MTNFIYCPGVWKSHLAHGISGLKLLLENGSDPNILFTPQFVHLVCCEKWPLIHHQKTEASPLGAGSIPIT